MSETKLSQRRTRLEKRISKSVMTFMLVFVNVFLGFGFILTVDAQAQTRRASDKQVQQIIRNVERHANRFRGSFDAALDRSRLDGSYTEDLANEYVKNFETATNNLRSRFNGRSAVSSDVDEVLNRAAQIDRFMQTNLKQRRVQNDWNVLKSHLQRLARAYNVSFNLMGRFVPSSASASQVPYRVSDRQVEAILRRIEIGSNKFRTSLDRALDRSRLDGTRREDNINEFVKDYENATDELKRKFDGKTSIEADVSSVLVRASRIDDFIRRNLRSEPLVQQDWRNLRSDLNTLASYYSLAFNLDNRSGMPAYSPLKPNNILTNADATFTGTYRLNSTLSDSARTVAGRVTNGLNYTQRERIFENLVRRLEAPEMLAVVRQGLRVTLASTISPQVILDADGMLHNETYPNGRASNVRASFAGDTLTVVSNGDRTNDFTAIFTSLEYGRRMMVTRRVFAEGLSQYVEVKSIYDRIEQQARFEVYNKNNSSNMSKQDIMNSFVVPDNTILRATLNQDFSTKTGRDGDRFTMTVLSPSQFSGAIVEGFVSNPNRSGRISGRSEATLNYETISLNNQTYRFAGITESVKTRSGENIRVDNEGGVKESSQTNQTIERTAIGAGIGAILGAILGGGQGAAIGAGVGAGAGAGSVYIQGRDDLELMSGTEFNIRASAPRN